MLQLGSTVQQHHGTSPCGVFFLWGMRERCLTNGWLTPVSGWKNMEKWCSKLLDFYDLQLQSFIHESHMSINKTGDVMHTEPFPGGWRSYPNWDPSAFTSTGMGIISLKWTWKRTRTLNLLNAVGDSMGQRQGLWGFGRALMFLGEALRCNAICHKLIWNVVGDTWKRCT